MISTRLASLFAIATIATGCGVVRAPGTVHTASAVGVRQASALKAVQVQGRRVSYQDAGKGSVVVLLHGFPLDHRMWEGTVQVLAPKYHVVAVDLAGFGDSQAQDGTATMEALADDVSAVIKAVNGGPAAVVGFSMGGYVALALAHGHPEQVRALGLIGTDAEPAVPGSDDTKWLLDLSQRVGAQGPQVAVDEMAPIMLAADDTDTTLAAQVRSLMTTATQQGTQGALLGMAVRHGAKDWLAQVKVPTLVAMGTADQVIPPDASRAIAAAIPNAKLQPLEGAGHILPIERPAAFNGLLGSWLDGLLARHLK